jgi:hypothetical protein
MHAQTTNETAKKCRSAPMAAFSCSKNCYIQFRRKLIGEQVLPS